MALKTPIYEYCPRCGQLDARLDGNGIVFNLHRCPDPVPGPVDPPRKLPLSMARLVQNGASEGQSDPTHEDVS
jgi:hypothetical protein